MHLSQRGYVMDKGQVSVALSGAEVANQAVLIDHLAV
jgi:hypothetical protein